MGWFERLFAKRKVSYPAAPEGRDTAPRPSSDLPAGASSAVAPVPPKKAPATPERRAETSLTDESAKIRDALRAVQDASRADPDRVFRIDARSDKFKRMEEEVADGERPGPEHQELLALMLDARAWGQAHGSPAFKAYPQYDRVRAVGERLHEAGGLSAMQKGHLHIRHQDPTVSSMLEDFWHGIGTWVR